LRGLLPYCNVTATRIAELLVVCVWRFPAIEVETLQIAHALAAYFGQKHGFGESMKKPLFFELFSGSLTKNSWKAGPS
jgi:hypothetical protein